MGAAGRSLEMSFVDRPQQPNQVVFGANGRVMHYIDALTGDFLRFARNCFEKPERAVIVARI